MSFASKFCTRDASALNESTRTPIFLLLVEQADLLDYRDQDRPEGWYRDDDGDLRHKPEGECTCGAVAPPCPHCEADTRVTFQEIKDARDDEIPIEISTRCEGVWLTRQEAQAWLDSHRYRFGPDSNPYVYAVCAEGELVEALRDGSEAKRGVA